MSPNSITGQRVFSVYCIGVGTESEIKVLLTGPMRDNRGLTEDLVKCDQVKIS